MVVNNAGYADPKRDADLLHADLDYFDEVFHVMVRSMMVITQQAVAWMTANGGGAIVNVASIGGLTGNLTGCYYGICKAGSVNFTRYVATQYGKAGVRCNCVAPGLVLTPAAERSLTDEYKELFIAHNAVDYAGQSEDIAGVIAFLASDDARYVTGQTVVADGGCTCHNPTVRDMRAFCGRTDYVQIKENTVQAKAPQTVSITAGTTQQPSLSVFTALYVETGKKNPSSGETNMTCPITIPVSSPEYSAPDKPARTTRPSRIFR